MGGGLLHEPYDAHAQKILRSLQSTWVFADGGVVGANPSPLGGTWAYRVLRDQEIVHEEAGAIPPKYGPVSNNLSELVAVLRGLEWVRMQGVPAVFVASDSLITLRRICSDRAAWNGIPGLVREWAHEILREVEVCAAVLLDGHPTRAHLAAGVGKSGRPVSEHNLWCDRACGQIAARIKAKESGVDA